MSTARGRARGQILVPGLAVVILAIVAMALMIDGALAFQGARDIELIAKSASQQAADEVDVANFTGARNIRVNATAAKATAIKAATDWLDQSGGGSIGIREAKGMANNGVVVSVRGNEVTVTITACFRRLINVPDTLGPLRWRDRRDDPQCGKDSKLTATAVARPRSGL